ncbi:hypothetical protein AB0E67_15675 [Streptomyces sp. NPDC032161]|uniref:hypothetical protein n=1 Tax=unclassified Streptomyces TaxID=2593676 RepID=UPI00340B7924
MTMAHIKALTAPVERKKGWQIAEHAAHVPLDRVQWSLARSVRRADHLHDRVGEFVVARLGQADWSWMRPPFSRSG